MIKYNKQIDTTDPFNKWIVLELRNFNPFNKHVGLVLTYIVEYLWVDTIQIQHANTNCHPYLWSLTIAFCPLPYIFVHSPSKSKSLESHKFHNCRSGKLLTVDKKKFYSSTSKVFDGRIRDLGSIFYLHQKLIGVLA